MLMREKRAIYARWTLRGRESWPRRNCASALLDAIADGNLQAIYYREVVAKAKDGDVPAPRSRGSADAVVGKRSENQSARYLR
jgi:hypothetical protein